MKEKHRAHRAGDLHDLGDRLRDRFLTHGRIRDLERAVRLFRTAVDAASAEDPDYPGYWYALGNGYKDRYYWQGHAGDDLKKAIEAYERAIQESSPGFHSLGLFLNGLAVALRERFFQTGHRQDLETAIQRLEEAVQRTPPQRGELSATILTNLGICLENYHLITTRQTDLDQAIRMHERALEHAPERTEARLSALNNLGNTLRLQFLRLREPALLDRSVELLATAARETPDTALRLPSRLNNLGNALRDRQILLAKDPADLDRAIEVYRRAESLIDGGHPEAAPILNNLANALVTRFESSPDPADLERAIHRYRQCLALTSEASPDLPPRFNNLANALRLRAETESKQEDLTEAQDLFLRAIRSGKDLHPEAVLIAGRTWGDWAIERRAWEEAASAYTHCLEVSFDILHGQPHRIAKESWLREVQGLSSRAAYALAKVGKPLGAIWVLEQGLGRLLRERLEMGPAQIQRLQEAGHNPLVDQYNTLVEQWLELRKQEPIAGRPPSALEPVEDQIEELLQAVRKLPGFGYLLSPIHSMRLDSLVDWRLAEDATLVYLLSIEDGGLALVVRPTPEATVTPLWLPELRRATLLGKIEEIMVATGFTPEEVSTSAPRAIRQRREAWYWNTLAPWLQQTVMEPLSNHLDSETWTILIPTGLLTVMPWHALQSGPEPRYALDDHVLSYAPNALGLFVHSRRSDLSQPPRHLVAVGNPQPTSEENIPWAGIEIEAIQPSFVGTDQHILLKEQATKEALLAAMHQATHLHLSCHAFFDPHNPSDSYLLLANDERLTLRELLELKPFRQTRLITLSACSSAIRDIGPMSDEATGLVAGFLEAGAAGVVAALGEADELATALLMRSFYRCYLRADAGTEAPLHPARALRQAQIWLREVTAETLIRILEGEDWGQTESSRQWVDQALTRFYLEAPETRPFHEPRYWSPFVHIGV